MVFNRAIPAIILLLGACDPGKSTTGEAQNSTGEVGESSQGETSELVGDESTGEPTTGGDDSCSTGDPAPDFGRAGEGCEVEGQWAACQAGGAAGIELCSWVTAHQRYEWTSCFAETCDVAASQRPCGADGTQYCVVLGFPDAPDVVAPPADLRWGLCNDAAACKPGDTDTCPIPEELVACVPDGVGNMVFEDCGFTPLVLSFGAAVEFAPAPVRALDFSLRGADACARADWPAAATPWLVLDRDGNGSIDDGRELFGSGTMLASGRYAPHGFAALAELDANHDGQLSPEDPSWADLLLWADHDADRRSSGWELLPLASFAIEAIELGFHTTRDCDTRGNCGAERSAFRYSADGRARRGEVIDVHLRCE
jgi:hypothetical protein